MQSDQEYSDMIKKLLNNISNEAGANESPLIYNPWVDIDEFDFKEPLLGFSVDTRDFHIIKHLEEKKKINDYDIIKKYSGFFFTMDEVKELVFDLYNRTGGKAKWRSINFKELNRTGWFKYLRIDITPKGYVVGAGSGDNIRYYKKSFYKGEIEDKYLNTH